MRQFGRPGRLVSSRLCGSVQPVVRPWTLRASDSLFHDQKALVVRNPFIDRLDHSIQGVALDLGELLNVLFRGLKRARSSSSRQAAGVPGLGPAPPLGRTMRYSKVA